MSDIVEEAIKETIAKARQLLSNCRGKLKGPEARLGFFTLQIVIPKAKAADVLHPQDGLIS